MVDELFGDAVVQLGLPPLPGGGRTPFPYHRFAAGDMVALCEGDAASLPNMAASSGVGGGRPPLDEEGPLPNMADEEGPWAAHSGVDTDTDGLAQGVDESLGSEGVVLQRTATSLLVVLLDQP